MLRVGDPVLIAAMDARRISDSIEGITVQREEVGDKSGRPGAEAL